VSMYGIRTDYAYNAWTIRYNNVYAGRIAPISAPKSKLYGNSYEPPVPEWPPSDFANDTYVTSGEKAKVTNTNFYSGSYSAMFSSDGSSDREYAYWHTDLSPKNEVRCDGYVNVNKSGINDANDRFFFFRLRSRNPANDLVFAGWISYGGRVVWCIGVRDGYDYVSAFSEESPKLNQWYQIEVHWVADSTNGYGELYVEGTLVATTAGTKADTAYLGLCSEIRFGLTQLVSCSNTAVYCDNFGIR
jgi:hypothetical protein